MSEAELFQLVVVDALRDFDAGEVLPLECIGQGGKNFQRAKALPRADAMLSRTPVLQSRRKTLSEQ